MTPGVLLDTLVLVWLLVDSLRLGAQTRHLMQAADPACYSGASVWELEIKRDLGKIILPADYLQAVAASGLRELPVIGEHAARISAVELPHRDPFDRLLLAQADAEGLSLLTADRALLGLALPNIVDATR